MKHSLSLVRLPHALGLPPPAYQSADSAGFDLAAAIGVETPVVLKPGARALVPTGLVFIIPSGHEAQIRPRSGLALKHGIGVLNAPGTIDADYRGEVQVLLINHGDQPFEVTRGMRIAQCVIAECVQVEIRETQAADVTARGAGGFGSTGV